MARPRGTKSNMRSPKEKEQIVLEAFKCGSNVTFKKYGISGRLLHTWMTKYRENGIDGLKSQTGKIFCHVWQSFKRITCKEIQN